MDRVHATVSPNSKFQIPNSARMTLSSRIQALAWWVGVPVIVGLLSWGPYIALNVIWHAPWPFWRVPFVPIAIFDSSAYFQWIGAALSGLVYGGHLSAFDLVILIVGRFLPDSWSVAEVWLLTQWLCVTAGIWLMAVAIQRWSGLSNWTSRGFSLLVWVSLTLPFMPRPGVYTWYLPFYACGLIGIWYVQRTLDQRKYFRSILWTLTAIALTRVYPFFVIHTLLWLLVMWFIHVHERFPRAVRMLFSVGIVTVLPMAVICTPILMRSTLSLTYEAQRHLGLAFTVLPVVSNSLIVLFSWIVLIFALMVVQRKEVALGQRWLRLIIGWVTLLMAWLSNLFTGVYIHNDHFRAPTVLLSWISVAIIWQIFKERSLTIEGADRSHPLVRICAWIPSALLLVGVAECALYLVGKRYVFHGDELNVVHASHWITYSVASALIVYRSRTMTRISTAVMIAFVGCICLLGFSARAYAFSKEQTKFVSTATDVPAMSWIREQVATDEHVCTDPEHAEIFGSFTSRLVYPTYATAVLPKSEAEILSDLKTELGFFTPETDFERGVYLDTFDSMRGTTCAQFLPFERMFRAIGLSQERIDVLTDCQRDQLKQDQSVLQQALSKPTRDLGRFTKLCPVVITTPETISRWSLPASYREIKITDAFSAWRFDPSSQ